MTHIPDYYRIPYRPVADQRATITSGPARFSILTDRIIRMEFDPQGVFEDRPSQAIWYRKQPVPDFNVDRNEEGLEIRTQFLHLTYRGGRFTKESLQIELMNEGVIWRFGDENDGNLGGTGRTLDGADGPIPLEQGLLSRNGWSVMDDSRSLVFDEDCWLQLRNAAPEKLDIYFFGFGDQYLACLSGYTAITGPVPMIPRYALGNWWSRYWEYDQAELTGLIEDFEQHSIPLGVCIIDMDWHITQTGNESSGWTGYTWNRDLFPDPAGQLKFLHDKKLHVALNLHPASGIYPHEEQYADMASRLGVNPESKAPIEFDIASPDFTNAYFELLHHPQEAMGVDFWWMDWQQGSKTKVEGLDPLWWLNHLHFYDLGRDGTKRSFVFSRWGGYGNHRYPIGFSGDTIVSWKSLAFQPYFTATAANVNYGWWSHDIGGHMWGVEDDELYLRWVQFGVFSPILRLHSTKNIFQDRRPWKSEPTVEKGITDAMQFRHRLVPYLYSMAWRYRRENIPPIVPMYFSHAKREEAYFCPNQYYFGSALIAAPFTTPVQKDTAMSRQVVWLPDGDWMSFWDGSVYMDGWHSIYGGLRDCPVFARRGAIVPLDGGPVRNGLDNPAWMDVLVFAGADGVFDLYEDEGTTNTYLENHCAITRMTQSYSDQKARFTIYPVDGDVSLTVPERNYLLKFRGYNQPSTVLLTVNGNPVDVNWSYDKATSTIVLQNFSIPAHSRVDVDLAIESGNLMNSGDTRYQRMHHYLTQFKLGSSVKEMIYRDLNAIVENPLALMKYKVQLTQRQMQAMVELLYSAGMERMNSTGEDLVIAWNNHDREDVRHFLSAERNTRNWWELPKMIQESGKQPRFTGLRIGNDVHPTNWEMGVSVADLVSMREAGK